MNRNRALIALVVAIAIAVIASRFVYRQIQQASAVKPLPVSHIVVASRPLALGTPLTAQDVELIAWPESTPLQGSFVRVQDCIGRSLITPISKNEPVLESKLAPKEAGVGLPAAIPIGMRAVSVRVDDVVGVSGFAMPGTMVDVLATGTPQGEDDSLTRNIIQDVRVLAAGQTVEQDTQGKPHTVGVVTLLLTPKQADQLTMASTDNRIHLALRNTIDTKIEDKAEPVFKSALLLGGAQPRRVGGGGGKPHPRREVTSSRPAGPAPYVVEVIRGDKKSNQTFSGQ